MKVRTIPDADVMNIPAHSTVAPDRGLLSKLHVAYNLGTGVNIRGRVNLRVNPTERSNHDFGKIVTQVIFELCTWYFELISSKDKEQSTEYKAPNHVLNCTHDPTARLTDRRPRGDVVHRLLIQGKAR